MSNFSSLAGLEVAEKFGVVWGGVVWGGVGWGGGFQVAAVSNLNASCLELRLNLYTMNQIGGSYDQKH